MARSAGTLILGAGHAGVQVAANLRSLGYQEPIRLVDAQRHMPYQRPPLSKTPLSELGDKKHALRAESFYEGFDVELDLGVKVAGIEPGSALTDAGERLKYDDLVLAFGAGPRKLTIPGNPMTGVHYLRTIDDMAAIHESLASATNVLVIGGGFIGLEVAALARAQGRQVVVVEQSDQLLGRSVSNTTAKAILEMHQDTGVQIRLGESVAQFRGRGSVEAAVLKSGEAISADLVVVGVGISREETQPAGIASIIDRGVLVDDFGRTRARNVYAAGDCTEFVHPSYPERGRLCLESVNNATDQAMRVAASITGAASPNAEVPWFWSDQGAIKFKAVGLPSGREQLIVRGALDEGRFSVLFLKDGVLVACESINRVGDHVAARTLIAEGARLDPALAADPSVRLLDTRTAA